MGTFAARDRFSGISGLRAMPKKKMHNRTLKIDAPQ